MLPKSSNCHETTTTSVSTRDSDWIYSNRAKLSTHTPMCFFFFFAKRIHLCVSRELLVTHYPRLREAMVALQCLYSIACATATHVLPEVVYLFLYHNASDSSADVGLVKQC